MTATLTKRRRQAYRQEEGFVFRDATLVDVVAEGAWTKAEARQHALRYLAFFFCFGVVGIVIDYDHCVHRNLVIILDWLLITFT